MKRLTERTTNGTAMAACCGENCKHNFCCENGGFAECGDMDDMICRLADIEDILGDEYDLERLRELVQADREGRCVVLPVREGDTVYHISIHPFEDYPPEIFECPFHITDYYNIGNTVFLTEEAAEAALKGEEND